MGLRERSWYPLWRGPRRQHAALWTCTVFGAGLSPVAPGTVGTLVAWGLVSALPDLTPLMWIGVGVVAFLLGWGATVVAQDRTGVHDPGWVVADEAAAYWLLYGVLGGGGVGAQAAMFFAFRLFDIWKPWPVRQIERRFDGPFGVMVDDVFAAAYAAAALWAMQRIMGG